MRDGGIGLERHRAQPAPTRVPLMGLVLVGVLLATTFVVVGRTPASAAPVGAITTPARGMAFATSIAKGHDGALWFVSAGGHAISRITPAGQHSVVLDTIAATAVAAGPAGTMWFTDVDAVHRIEPGGAVSTVADLPPNSRPSHLAMAPNGDIWTANRGNPDKVPQVYPSISRITQAGVVSTFALDQVFREPGGIAAGPDGNMWFTRGSANGYDPVKGVIARITPAGVITPFTHATVDSPQAITAGPDGNLWFTNSGANSIGRITPAGVITAHTGTDISYPYGITAGPDGNLWFTNYDATTIGRITPAGAVTTFPGAGHSANSITAGPDGNLWYTNVLPGAVGRITPAGMTSSFPGEVFYPRGVTAGPDGNVWFTNQGYPLTTGYGVGRVTPAGVVTTFQHLSISNPEEIVTGPDGNLWFTNNGNNSIGRVTPAGVVTNYTSPTIKGPRGIASGPDGNVWFTNAGLNDSIGKITPAGVVASFTGAGISNPSGIVAGPDGNLWFTNNGNNSIGRITPAGVVANFTGAGISNPHDIAGGPDGNLWFTNNGNNSIGRVTPAGVVANFTGAGISDPVGIAAGPDGNLWFTNAGALDSIGRITPGGTVSSFTAPSVKSPVSITAGPDGGMWFANWANSSIGRINALAEPELPDAPSSVVAAAGNQSATVSWAAPASDGGAPITKYTVTASPGGKTCTWSAGPLTCSITGLANGTAYTFSVTATNSVGTGPATSASTPVTPAAGRFFHPVAPTRILDSRGPNGGWSGPLAAGAPRTLTVTGGPAALPANVDAVVLNVTVTGGTANSFLSAYPAGGSVPNVSNLNFAGGQTTPNLVTVKVGAEGKVAFANAAGATHVIADVAGYFDDQPADRYNAVTPQRILDSRGPTGGWNGRLTAGTPRTLAVAGAGGPVPATADAVIMNVTVTGGSANSFLTAYPAGGSVPNASNLNFAAGETIPNLVAVKIGAGGHVAFANAAGSVDVIADVAGYFDSTTGDLFHAVAPTRILDSRGATGGWNGKLAAGAARPLPVIGQGGVPAGATAIIANTTVTAGSTNSFVSVYPTGTVPATSNVNFAAGQTIPNLTAVKIGTNGNVSFANANGTTDVIFDIAGFFAPT